jgi:hypothetical protein
VHSRKPGSAQKIPTSKGALWLLGLRFLPNTIPQVPDCVGVRLGAETYDGKMLLVDRHTASAAGMVTIFAKEK